MEDKFIDNSRGILKTILKVNDKSSDEGIISISNMYQNLMDEDSKKRTGSFYTDINIIRYMLKEVLQHVDIAQNPYVKILDPACGCGYFLLEAYDMLVDMYRLKLPRINKRYPGLDLNLDNLHEHILKYNIFGEDIDENAVKLAKLGLMLKKKDSNALPNIECRDSINDLYYKYGKLYKSFDVIVGNPPYIGHKKLSKAYRKQLNEIYGDIFKDKADISFCFIKNSIDRLILGGRLCFITSRYFLESPSGEALRKYISGKCIIEKIIDFYGVRIMKGISIDPLILFLKKSNKISKNSIRVVRAKDSLKNMELENVFNELGKKDTCCFKSFDVLQSGLKDKGWMLLNEKEMSIIHKIEKGPVSSLFNICQSFQGIITGCDRAFVIDESEIEKYGIERDIIRPWIKNSSIDSFKVKPADKYIIYSDFISDPKEYKNAISHIGKYRARLEGRRECKKGARLWYQLQWGRKSNLFESKKIIFPYKSSRSRFALDCGSYCSADIYGMFIKRDCPMSYEFLLGVLNSSLYEFYFKSFAKKLGDELYDYYPNTVMRLMVPCKEDGSISNIASRIMKCSGDDKLKYMNEIDTRLYDMFDLDTSEIEIIEGRKKDDIHRNIRL